MGEGPFAKEHWNLGARPRLPIVLTKHAVRRYAERHCAAGTSLADAQRELQERAKGCGWAGKTARGALVLKDGDLWLIVQRWECKYRVITVLPQNGPQEIMPPDADIVPASPGQRQFYPLADFVNREDGGAFVHVPSKKARRRARKKILAAAGLIGTKKKNPGTP